VAQRAESLGDDVVVMGDHVGSELSPMLTLAAVAQRTERIRLGTMLVNADLSVSERLRQRVRHDRRWKVPTQGAPQRRLQRGNERLELPAGPDDDPLTPLTTHPCDRATRCSWRSGLRFVFGLNGLLGLNGPGRAVDSRPRRNLHVDPGIVDQAGEHASSRHARRAVSS
jgi:Luciferase-like monooxygenase